MWDEQYNRTAMHCHGKSDQTEEAATRLPAAGCSALSWFVGMGSTNTRPCAELLCNNTHPGGLAVAAPLTKQLSLPLCPALHPASCSCPCRLQRRAAATSTAARCSCRPSALQQLLELALHLLHF